MQTPTRAAFMELCEKGNIVPIYRTLMADTMTPVLALSRFDSQKYVCMLESVVGGEKIGRYSFLGIEPACIVKAMGTRVEITDCARGTTSNEEHPCVIDRLGELLSAYQPAHVPGLPRLTGGAIGYFGYDLIRQVEPVGEGPQRSLGMPDMYFGIYHSMLIFDHVSRTLKVVVHADCRKTHPDAAYDQAVAQIDRLCAQLQQPGEISVEPLPHMPDEDPDFESNFSKEDFEKAVATSQEYIRAGDIFQIVLSQRFNMSCTATPFQVYRTLRTINPSPYMFYLKFPELTLVGSSPEVMVRVEDGEITVRPIAGTRQRGATPEEDQALADDLLADKKELAEHTMLLDLGRNDVGRVSEYGSVNVTDQFIIEQYSHVMHIVSNVKGQLRTGATALDTLKACMPAGTVSGAPKVRAMQIIDEFEPDRRGTYAGAVGYVDFSGNMDTCIALRTICMINEVAYVQAGAGIVLDSIPENEYYETRSKARALLRAIRAAEQA